jgi:glucokinase
MLGVDVGGTRISAGLVTRDGQVLHALSRSSRAIDGDGVATLKQVIQDLLAHASTENVPVIGIGVGVPGAVNLSAGTVSADALNLPELSGVPLRDVLREAFGLPVVLDNDVNAFAVGEMLFGVAQGARTFVCLTLGTGVGGAIVINGQLFRGATGFAGEIGHATVQWDGRPCFCGSRGCLKAYVAGPDIVAQANELLFAVNSEQLAVSSERLAQDARRKTQDAFSDAADVFRAAQQGDAIAQEVIARVVRILGAGIGNLVNIFNPELIVLGGSVAQGLALRLDEVKQWAEDYALSEAFQAARIELSTFDKQAAFLGPAALFINHPPSIIDH